jgi:hypothetical protein
MRKASLILSITPFGVALILVALMLSADGFDGLRVMVVLFFAFPVLMLMSIASVVLAYRKTAQPANDTAAKVMSIISVAVFGVLGALSLVMFVVSQAAYSQYAA